MNRIFVALVLMLGSAAAFAFDHSHAVWGALLKNHVVLVQGGNAAQVRYAGMLAERRSLKAYLDSLSAVTETEYRGWTKSQKLAFLINAYNAFTVELILTKYPDLLSIKDLGSLFQSPWKRRLFTLLGSERTLDDIEHGLIRAPGTFDEPRIHVTLVCASIGCPMLRNETYTAERIEAQMEDGMRRFLSDRTRNRFDAAGGTLRVSKLFDWYGKDFEIGHAGFTSLAATFAKHAERMADTPEAQARIRSGDYRLEFLEYDWKLNDAR
ncbi:MAG: DUF547 domain-containing protein [Deltaproteobacteria bacterium]|nr:DUF547 domain-containing protein [Deltaproteobacteria bacterium]